MKDLDEKVIKIMVRHTCPKCGEFLDAVITDGVVVAFDCLNCHETYSFDNIYCS